MSDFNENEYKPDFEILDKYINFSSELLRLSLLGISGVGTLILLRYSANTKLDLAHSTKVLLFISVLFWSLSSGFALAHRFFASDSMAYHIAYLRKKDIEQKEGRRKLLKFSNLMLILTEYHFGFGVLFFAFSIYQIFFGVQNI